MKSLLLALCGLLSLSFSSSAQWTARTSFPGTSRAKATAFTIGSKIYLVGGVANSGLILRDFWEYDISTNTWLQKPAFPGPERYGATSFVLNGQGYVATGGNDNGYLDDLWQFDPASGTWIQKTGLPVQSPQHENQRREAFSFVVGNRAYLGGGDGWVFGANQTSNYAFPDLWEYNPANDTWTPKSGFPDFFGRDLSIAVSMYSKGYVGLGCNVGQTINYQTFWQYDPATDTWTSKPNFPTAFSADAGAFVFDSNLYVVGGIRMSPLAASNQVYKFDPVANTWTQQPNYNGGAVVGEVCISAATQAFAQGGYNGSLVTRNDLWEFTPTITGIHEVHSASGITATLFPNPAQEVIYLRASKEITSVEIYDITGLLVSEGKNELNGIDIRNLQTGLYNMKMIFADGTSMFSRFIKAN